MRTASLGFLIGLSLTPHDCTRGSASTATTSPSASSAAAERAPASSATGPIRIEELAGTTPAVFVLRGAPVGPEKLVFLHGMCSHGLGSAQAFQRAAAQRGTLIAPLADIACGDGHSARWSKDVAALDRRIQATFVALGHAEPIRDIIVIGYSQGASRAESLARQFPDVYTRLVLMGGPYAADPHGLESLRGAVAMAGDRDRLDLMQASARSLAKAGVPATFLLIPEATHGSLGPHPEATMDEMLTWLSKNERPLAALR